MSGLPLAELLGLPSLSRARLLAGDPWRRMGWVHVVDVPEPAPWVRPGQLVLVRLAPEGPRRHRPGGAPVL
jgi:purine catabolism regulator